MRNSRLFVSLIAVVALTCTGVTGVGVQPAAAGAFSEVINDISYTTNDVDAGATVEDYSGSGGAVVIPASVTIAGTEYPVTTIGFHALGRKNITSVTIPSSIKTIGGYAFVGNRLTEVDIPSGVTTIEYGAFYINQLARVTLPDTLTTIQGAAFASNSLRQVSIPRSVGRIGSSAFARNQLSSVTFHNGLTAIDYYAFEGNQLVAVTIPPSVETIDFGAFLGNPLTTVRLMGFAPTIEASFQTWMGDRGSFGAAAGVTVYYLPQNATGFTSPWSGYTTTDARPSISGVAQVGNELSAQAPSFQPGTELLYSWTQAGNEVVLSTNKTYVPTVSDMGAPLTVTVTGAWAGSESTTLTSTATAAVVGRFATTAPTISGNPQVGQNLTVSGLSTWSPAPTTLTYTWSKSNGSVVIGTGDTYVVSPADVGESVMVSVTAEKAGYGTTTVSSAATTPVLPLIFTSTPTPTISGVSQVGQPLTTVRGTWPANTTFTYAWKWSGTGTVVGTGETYTPAAEDLGKNLTVTVTASLPGYTTTSVTSIRAAAPVAVGAFASTPTPTISGVSQVGQPRACQVLCVSGSGLVVRGRD